MYHSRYSAHRPSAPNCGTNTLVGAGDALVRALHLPEAFLLRHKRGDWGELPDEDHLENEPALIHGSRLVSAYDTRSGDRPSFITEWHRGVAILLLPAESWAARRGLPRSGRRE